MRIQIGDNNNNGKAGVSFDIEKLSLKFGNLLIIQNGKINPNYSETEALEYMKASNIDIVIDIFNESKNFMYIQWT